jgi:hypothetical protein
LMRLLSCCSSVGRERERAASQSRRAGNNGKRWGRRRGRWGRGLRHCGVRVQGEMGVGVGVVGRAWSQNVSRVFVKTQFSLLRLELKFRTRAWVQNKWTHFCTIWTFWTVSRFLENLRAFSQNSQTQRCATRTTGNTGVRGKGLSF